MIMSIKQVFTQTVIPAKDTLLAYMLLLLLSHPLVAETLTPPRDPAQSITYWKPHTLEASDDAAVALAQQVFKILLRTWDGSRVAPDLYVVQSSGGPWAASLADGNILLSRSAIEVCLSLGEQKAQHLLAFILSHELAHQRADDLWHHKFLRLAGSQAPQVQQKILKDLTFDEDSINDLEQREAQADHNGLLIMTSVGYDPFQVIDQKDFFTTWVENIWNISCSGQEKPIRTSNACAKAQSRALRTRTQLTAVATQATLFELGVQAYVAGYYSKARQYFAAYGKDYPSRAIYSNLGLTYLRQALDVQNQLLSLDNTIINFHYPLRLDDGTYHAPNDTRVSVVKRGDARGAIRQLKTQRHQHIEAAISHFEKAIRLEPSYRHSYRLLAMSYLLDGNTFMVRGILQGKYIPQFKPDDDTTLLLAMTMAQEGKLQDAIKHFSDSLEKLKNNPTAADDLLTYTLTYNLAATLIQAGSPEEAATTWENLALQAKNNRNGLLFQLVLNQLGKSTPVTNHHDNARVADYQLGQSYTNTGKQLISRDDLWLEGDKYQVLRIEPGIKLIVNHKNRIISAAQLTNNDISHAVLDPTSTYITSPSNIRIGDISDRPIKRFGIPSRRIHVISGEYLAYDNLGLGIRINNNRVAGWFLYEPM